LLDAQAVAKRTAVFGEIHTHDAVEIGNPLSSLRYRWVVEGPWKLIQPNAALEPEAAVQLFNVAADPHEKNNLAEKETARVTQLRKLLDGWWKVP
jgi:arylsulfatase A-like enzyme